MSQTPKTSLPETNRFIEEETTSFLTVVPLHVYSPASLVFKCLNVMLLVVSSAQDAF